METHPITTKELWLAESALFVAILLQIAVWVIGPSLVSGLQYGIIVTEIALAAIIGISARHRHKPANMLHRPLSFVLLALLSAANISSFLMVARLLIVPRQHLDGLELLVAAVAIFLTNIIVFSLWYWEIDSPGLSGRKWSKHDRDFQFTQQDLGPGFAGWRPSFLDYLYLSVTNAINFAPADARPLSPKSKVLMGVQALVSVFTLALIVARSVGILGQS